MHTLTLTLACHPHTHHLVRVLLHMLAHSPHARHVWTHYLNAHHEGWWPGAPKGYMHRLLVYLITHFPQQMLHILHHKPSTL